ncbi:MAG TPA: hypothetical protein HA261_04510 [Methanosarcina sp.]|nr:hypothetical protein [Methanosarcina sp.]
MRIDVLKEPVLSLVFIFMFFMLDEGERPSQKVKIKLQCKSNVKNLLKGRKPKQILPGILFPYLFHIYYFSSPFSSYYYPLPPAFFAGPPDKLAGNSHVTANLKPVFGIKENYYLGLEDISSNYCFSYAISVCWMFLLS